MHMQKHLLIQAVQQELVVLLQGCHRCCRCRRNSIGCRVESPIEAICAGLSVI